MVGVYLMCGGVCDEECEIAPTASARMRDAAREQRSASPTLTKGATQD
jgi:hypothetical protein